MGVMIMLPRVFVWLIQRGGIHSGSPSGLMRQVQPFGRKGCGGICTAKSGCQDRWGRRESNPQYDAGRTIGVGGCSREMSIRRLWRSGPWFVRQWRAVGFCPLTPARTAPHSRSREQSEISTPHLRSREQSEISTPHSRSRKQSRDEDQNSHLKRIDEIVPRDGVTLASTSPISARILTGGSKR
jgi:hypothetical protein